MPKIDVAAITKIKGTRYPAPFNDPCSERIRQRLGNVSGLTDFGVILIRQPPGNWWSQWHLHSEEEEFVYVLEGELTLIEDGGETVLRAGDCAALPDGVRERASHNQQVGHNSHLSRSGDTLANRSHRLCSDSDMMSFNTDGRFVHKDGMQLDHTDTHQHLAELPRHLFNRD